MTLEIRKAEPDDLDTLQSITRHTIDMNYRVFLGNKKVDAFISGPSDVLIASKMGDTYVLSVEGAVRGFAAIKGDIIELMMMRHEDRRQGWGSMLIAAMEEALFKTHSQIRVESFKENHETNQFYLKNNWKNIACEFDEKAGEFIYIFSKKRQK